ncbi:hypothetical protein [Shewanella dokdonensis]|uniref:Uncharacterized protein n=1 Tax=Shewanella dokdonensis TaxID=712036 RepID=A0ABX8DF84_9GAMM|nr:hypothetical protein [Shewanella dokdonensis]MCL1076482.1 hypothetical protein [Shewanella dokdonensis]QVK23296.1 hypothetical protein KHX94_00160 [Shewanella dokdonensis]
MKQTVTGLTPEFNAALYWSNKPIKKFVCTLRDRETGKLEQCVYGASCSDRAAELALENTALNRETTLVVDIHLATPEELGCEVTAPLPIEQKLTQIAEANALQTFRLQQHFLLGNLPAITAVENLKHHCSRLGAALADTLAMLQVCEMHRRCPEDWPDPVNTMEWDVAVAAAALVLKEATNEASN